MLFAFFVSSRIRNKIYLGGLNGLKWIIEAFGADGIGLLYVLLTSSISVCVLGVLEHTLIPT